MKKILGISFLAALIGGVAAIGGYKLFDRNQIGSTISEKQQIYFANNPSKVSSTGEVDFVQAAAAVSPGVVHIKTTYAATKNSRGGGSPFDMFEDFFGGGGRQMQAQPRAASGSGVIISPDGYIVTNNHVVENASKVEVVLTDRRKVTAKVIGTDPNTDLALIKVEATNLPVVKMGNSDNVQVGEWVLAVGFPLDLQTTVTAGIVSAKSRSIGIIGREQQGGQMTEEEYDEYRRTGKRPKAQANTGIESFIQTDAAINPGNSGGALVNARGELVGINSAIASQSGYNQGYGFAIPINLAKKILDDFMKYGSVKRGFIGVSFVALNADNAGSEEIKTKEITGLYVSDVSPQGAGAAAGIKSGDIIKKVDGVTVYDSPDLQEKIGRLHPGDKVKLTILREGALKDYTVTLKDESSVNIASNTTIKGVEISKLGASFAPITKAQKSKFGIENGVVVTSVVSGKILDNLDVKPGVIITKINGLDINNTDDVKKALTQGKKDMIYMSGVSNQGSVNYSFPAQ